MKLVDKPLTGWLCLTIGRTRKQACITGDINEAYQMPSTFFLSSPPSLTVSETISFIPSSLLLSIWSSCSSEARHISLLFLECTPTSLNPSSRLISLFDSVYLILIFLFNIILAFLLLHLLPLPFSDPSFPITMLAVPLWIMKKKKKKKVGVVSGEAEHWKRNCFELSQLPKHWWYFPLLNMESWRDEDVNYLQHY